MNVSSREKAKSKAGESFANAEEIKHEWKGTQLGD